MTSSLPSRTLPGADLTHAFDGPWWQNDHAVRCAECGRQDTFAAKSGVCASGRA